MIQVPSSRPTHPRLGFTGTRHGATPDQLRTLRVVLRKHPRWWLDHGDCVGVDAQVHVLAREMGFSDNAIWVHPPDDARLRAHCKAPPGRIFLPKPYMVRNRDIVDIAHKLIAVPAETAEQMRSGTWATVRYARSLKRPIKIILPSGKVRNEGWEL
jgi:hypothetical protein